MSTLEKRATLGVNIAFFVLSWIAVGLRVFVRAGMLRNFGSDDWTMLVTQMFFTAYLVVQLGGIMHGTGQHLVDLDPRNAELALKYWYFCEIFYVCATSFLKVSIGLFLLRVATNKMHIWVVRIVMILAAVFGFAFFFVLIFQCWPISDWWSLNPNKSCIKADIVVGLTYGVSGLNVIADWTLGILPAFIVKDLQMSTRQKRLVAIILSFAAIGSSATIVRLPYVGSLSQSFDGSNGDFLFNTVGVAIWTTVEIGVGVTAGCMATLRPLIRMAFEKMGVGSSSGGRRSGAMPRSRSRGRATPLDDFVMVSPKHGRTITTITGNDRDTSESARRSRSSSRERLARHDAPDKIMKHMIVEYDESEADSERQHGFTPLPRRS